MADIVSGVVKVVSKSPKGYYSIKVDEEWYGFGMKKPPCDKDDNVTFNYTQRGDFKSVDIATLELGAKEPKGSVKSSAGREDYWTNKAETDKVQQSVREFHAARASAIETVGVLTSAGAVKLPATESKRLDVVLALIDEITGRYYSTVIEQFYGDNVEVEDDAKREED